MRMFLAASAFVALLVPGVAGAGPVATVTAGYDPIEQNPYFIIANTSNALETGLTLTTSFGPTTSVSIANLAAGQIETYQFNASNGGYLVGGGENDVDDSTTYKLMLTISGVTLSSDVFSPADNLTGGDVDFLGNQCFGYAPCSVALSGEVAQVPEPQTLAMLSFGLLALGAIRRRAL